MNSLEQIIQQQKNVPNTSNDTTTDSMVAFHPEKQKTTE